MRVLKVCQVVPSMLAIIWNSSPVAKRLMLWSTTSRDPAIIYHFGQVALFFTSALFFTYPLLELCFPGRCDFVGRSYQMFHVLISCCRGLVSGPCLPARLCAPHKIREAAVFVYVFTLVVCVLIVAFMLRKVKQVLDLAIRQPAPLTLNN
uniref:Uncharacterized protein n=1 Tax=Dicentrarchus labrax TaxID=13489 RepID=A0A8P4G5Q8_DICLA